MGVGETGATIIAWTTKETEVYNTHPFWRKMKCPSSMHPLTVRKGRIVKYRNFSHGMSDFACKTKIVSTLYNLAETPCSTGFLVVVQSNVDKTNQSYYGDSKLCYLTSDGMHEGLVPLRMFLLLVKELIIGYIMSIRRVTFYFFWTNWQGKMGPFTMLSGHILAWNLLLYMGVSFSLWYIQYGDKRWY